MIRAHSAALAAFLQAQGVKVYVGEAGVLPDESVEAPDFPYAILVVPPPVSSTEHFTNHRERNELDVTIGFHGLTLNSAQWVAERVMRLAGKKLVVEGWQPIAESVFASLPRLDRDNPEQPVWSGAAGFTVTTYPA